MAAALKCAAAELSSVLFHSYRASVAQHPPMSAGGDEPAHVADEVTDALQSRQRDGAIDLPTKRGPRAPRIGDRVRIVSGPFVGQSGLCTQVSRQQIGVLLLMFKAQRQVQSPPRCGRAGLMDRRRNGALRLNAYHHGPRSSCERDG
jgi:hypothetical protein